MADCQLIIIFHDQWSCTTFIKNEPKHNMYVHLFFKATLIASLLFSCDIAPFSLAILTTTDFCTCFLFCRLAYALWENMDAYSWSRQEWDVRTRPDFLLLGRTAINFVIITVLLLLPAISIHVRLVKQLCTIFLFGFLFWQQHFYGSMVDRYYR